MNGFAHWLVVFNDKIENGIEYEIFPMLQQQWTRLTTLTHIGVGRRMAVARGDDVAVAGKNMGLNELELAFFHDGRIRNDEQRIAKGFQLRTAVFFQGVFNGRFMQVELALQVVQFLGVRLFKADPDKVPRLCSPGCAFVEGDVGDFFTSAVNRSSNNSTHDVDSLLLGSFLWQMAVAGSVQLSLVCYRESVKSCRSQACRRRRPPIRWICLRSYCIFKRLAAADPSNRCIRASARGTGPLTSACHPGSIPRSEWPARNGSEFSHCASGSIA